MKPALLIGGIALAITGVVGYNFIYVPGQREVRLFRTQITQEEKKQETEQEVAVLLDQLEGYRKHLPQTPDPSWLSGQAVELAERSGILLASISKGAPQTAGQFTRLTVDLEFSASYHQLGEFLDQVERSDHFLRVERLTVNRASLEQSSDLSPTVQLTLGTLYLPALGSGS